MTPTQAPPEKGIKIEVFLLMISSHRFSASNGLEKAEKTLWTELVVKFFIVCVHSGFISRRWWNGWVNVDGVLFQPIAPMSCCGVFSEHSSIRKWRHFNGISRSDGMLFVANFTTTAQSRWWK